MKHWRITLLALAIALTTVLAPVSNAQQPSQQIMSNVKVGDMAPDFTLRDHNGNQVKLSDFKGKKNVVLAFYVLAFTAG